MRKMGKKGFMMAEVVVVSVVVATVLVTLFVGLSRVSSAYELRNRYYDIDALYLSMEANDLLLSNNFMETFFNSNSQELIDNDYKNCYVTCRDEVNTCGDNCNDGDYTCYDNCSNIGDVCFDDCQDKFSTSYLKDLKNNNSNYKIRFFYAPYSEEAISSLRNLENINETFKDYIDYVSTSFDYDSSKVSGDIDSCDSYDNYYYFPSPSNPNIPMYFDNDNQLVSSLLVNDLGINNSTKGRLIDWNSDFSGNMSSDNFYLYVLVTEMCDINDKNNCKYYGLKVGRTRYCAMVEKNIPKES